MPNEPQVKVSRGEEALYGSMAGPVRVLSTMLANVEDAQVLLWELLEEARRGDELERGKTSASEEARNGRDSAHTEWVEAKWEQIVALHKLTRRTLQEISLEAQQRWMDAESRFSEAGSTPA